MDPLTVAGIGTTGNVLGSIIGGLGGARTAESEQALRNQMMERQIAEGYKAYGDIAPTYEPYMQAGQQGIAGLGRLAQSAGEYDYTPQEFQYEGQVSDFLDPSNAYAGEQAQRALMAQYAMPNGVGINSGGAMQELQKQQFQLGQQGYQQALNNMNTDSNTKYGRFTDFGNQTSSALQNAFNNRFQVANQQTSQGQFGTSGNANARMNVANNTSSAIGNQIGAQAQNVGNQAGAPYAMGMGVLGSVFNNDNMNALGQQFPQAQQGYSNTPNTFNSQYQQPQNQGFGISAPTYLGNQTMSQNPRVGQGNINPSRGY